MSKKKIKFEIVTPERVVLKKDIFQVTVPTQEGEITVLPDHIPLMSILKPGVLEIKNEAGEIEVMSVSGGFLQVTRGKIIVLADTAEKAEELDEQRIEEAKARAEEKRKELSSSDQVQFANISVQLDKELARFKALNRWRKLRK